jgi:hypothetical protein
VVGVKRHDEGSPVLDERGLRVFVSLADYDWFRFHASRENVEEINF